ncbi:hypothetical protein ACFS7Z_03475 [Pontibacter toksunensis]|uniref:Uncharacterized protein n=1 Tax=Pontibacter toksunensis TaxID=1332631 RepID=A0ABW6BQ60_9BACT
MNLLFHVSALLLFSVYTSILLPEFGLRPFYGFLVQAKEGKVQDWQEAGIQQGSKASR